jgi:hypothetical protein
MSLEDISDDGTWTITGGPDVASIDLNGDIITVDGDTEPGTYELTFTLDAPADGCTEFQTEDLVVVDPPVVIFEVATGCNQENQGGDIPSNIIDLTSYFDPASTSTSGTWSTTVPGLDISNPAQVDVTGFIGMTPLTVTFTTNNAADPCDEIVTDLTINVIDCDCPGILSPADQCNSGGTIDLATLTTGIGTWSVTDGPDITSVTQSGDVLTIDGDTAPGEYTVTFVETNPNDGCPLELTETFEVIAEPVVEFTLATACNAINESGSDDSNVIDLTVYFTPESTQSGSWSADPALGLDLSNPMAVDFAGLIGSTPITITFTTDDAVDPCIDISEDLIVEVIDCGCPNLTVEDPEPICNDGGTVDLSLSETTSTVDGSWSEDPANGTLGILSGDIVTVDGTVGAGVYTFIFTPDVAGSDGCPETSSVDLTVSQSASAGVGETVERCDSDIETLTLRDFLTGEDDGGVWSETSAISSTPGAFDALAGTFVIDSEVPGTYEFTYTLTPVDPCTDDDALVVVIINADPIADAGADMILDCSGAPAALGGSTTSSGGGFSYSWTVQGTTDVVSTDITTDVIADGTYVLQVTNDATGCTSEDMVVVGTDPALPVIMVDDCTDMGEGIIFINEASGINAPLVIELVDSDGNIELIPYDGSMSEIDGLDPDTYSVTLIDNIDCRSVTQPAIIFSTESIIDNTIDGDSVQVGTTYTLDIADFLIQGDNIVSVVWSEDDGTIICEGTPDDCSLIMFDVIRANTICLTITDENGCVNEDCIFLRLIIENQVYTPNIFNPGSDTDDAFVFPITDKTAVVPIFSVYDRWGNLIFTRENFESNVPELGWDGTFNGEQVEQGVYVYIYDVEFPNGERRSVAQDITLIR